MRRKLNVGQEWEILESIVEIETDSGATILVEHMYRNQEVIEIQCSRYTDEELPRTAQ
jgi:hypothetical protein